MLLALSALIVALLPAASYAEASTSLPDRPEASTSLPDRPETPVGAVVTGSVHDERTGLAIAGARVTIGDLVVESGADGALPPIEIPIDALRAEVDVEASAPGFAPWRFVGVELGLDRPIELQIKLGDRPAVWEPTPAAAAIPWDGPPESINVGRTFSAACIYPPTNVQRVDRIAFRDYVKNVLPNEWFPNWPAASLEAGAVAVQQYGWATGFVVRKWTRYGYPFDVVDGGCDQYYKDRDPARSYTLSDAAVERMWGTVLLRDGKLIPLYFRDRDSTCVRQGAVKDCMRQWETYYLAQEGWSSLQILHRYYDPVTDYRVSPANRAVQVGRSPDPSLRRGGSQTLRACLRNAGSNDWKSGNIVLALVDPAAPDQLLSSSPLAGEEWLAPNRPATLSRPTVAAGAQDAITFAISAPSSLAPGTYKLALRPYAIDSGTLLPIDAPFVWTVTVGAAALPLRLWVPMAARSAQTAAPLCN